MFLFNFFLKLKFKYVISFIFVITFYIFAFEKRYFQINSDWKLLCFESSISLCDFEIKLTNIKSHKTINLAILSKSSRNLVIVDVYNSSMTNADILAHPKLILSQEKLDDLILFDLKQKSEGSFMFLGIQSSGDILCYNDWHLIFRKSVVNKTLTNHNNEYIFHSIDLLLKENLILISALWNKPDDEQNTPIIICLNASDGTFIWKVTVENDQHVLIKHNNSNATSRSEVFTHWKLNLMQHHKDLNHLKQKSNHINLKENFPIYFNGKSQVRLMRSQKRLISVDKRISEVDKISANYNSIIFLHKHGLSLFDIHNGVLLASENIEFDKHSAYTSWPSSDHQQEESLYQIKFVSKLDHYTKEYMDINHDHNQLSSDAETHQHKIHCNLVFNKINPAASLNHEANSWFVGHLCDPVSYMDYPRFSEKTWLEDPLKSVAPLITNDYAYPSGLWGRLYHLIGRKLIDKNSKNAICMSSDGLMTSLSSHGHQNWRTNAQIGWLHISRMIKMESENFIDSASRMVYEKHFNPSITEVTLSYLNQTIRAVLSLGFESISLVDLSDGYLLASHSLPCTPVDKPIVINVPYQGMLALSGDQIVIVKCENMIIGFSVTHYIPWMYFIILCTLMLTAILFLMWSLDPRNAYFGELLV